MRSRKGLAVPMRQRDDPRVNKSDNPIVTFGTGLVCGALVLGLLILIGAVIHLRSGFYGFSSLTLP